MDRELSFLLQAMGVGVLIPFGYDWLRILRRVIPHKQLAVSLEDFFFWVACAISVFLWMYRVSNGGLRWFAVAGAVLGMFFYKKLFSGILVIFVSRLIRFLLRILGKMLKIVTTPLRYAGRKAGAWQVRVQNRRRKIWGNLKIRLKSCLKAFKIGVTRK